MARRVMLEILGNAEGFKRATRESVAASNTLSRGLKKVAIDAKASANVQVEASVKKTNRLHQEVRAYRELASSARKGSREQVAAANLAASAEKRLSRSLGVTAMEQRELQHSAAKTEHALGRGARGALAGSGAFKSMGRSIAFASGAFIGVAGVSTFLHSSIEAAVEATAIQKQLAAQFKASGMNLKDYQKQIDETTGRLSSLSGFTRDDLVKTFTTAFRGTKNVATSLKLEAVAADAARGSHKDLATVSLALTKGVLGSSGALRRLGIIVPKTAHGMQVLNFVQRKFAGQARAGTTAQQRFAAELHNSQVIIGSALLPVITRLLGHGARWLSQMNRSGQLQRNVNSVVRTATAVFSGLARVLRIARAVLTPFVHALGGVRNAATVAGLAFLLLKVRALGLGVGLGHAVTKAGLLRGKLLSLKNIGPIALVVALSFVPKSKQGQNVLDKTGLGVLGKVPVLGHAFQQEAKYENKVANFFGRGVNTSAPKGAPKPPPGYDGRTYGMAPSTRQNPGGYLKKGTAPAGFEPGTYGQAPSSRLNPGGYLPRAHAVAGAAATDTKPSGPLGLKARFANLDLRLAQAGLTSGQGDDKSVLRQEAANLRRQIARLPQDHKHLQERTQLYQQLGQVQSQIQSIDQAAAQKKKDAEAKQLALKKKERERDKKHKDKVEAEEKKQDEQEKKHREALKRTQDAIRQKMAEAVTNARSLIGDLFSGPVLNPSEAQKKRQLGVPGPDAHKLVADVIAQTRAFRGTTRDLGVLRRAGASKQLIGELEGTDPEQLHALATASPKVRKQFLQAFAQRQKAIQSRAKFDIHSPHVTVAAKRIDIGGEITVVVHSTTTLDGHKISKSVTKHQQKTSRRTAAQRGGRHPGTVHGIH